MTTPFAQDVEHAVLGPRIRPALRPHPRLVRLRVRGVQRLVQRQDEPGAPLLARPRSRRHPLLGPTGRGRSTPIPSRRRRTRTRSSRSDSGPATTTVPDAAYYSYTAPGAPRTARPTALRGRWIPSGFQLLGDPSLRGRPDAQRSKNDAARLLPERLRGGRPPRRLGHDQLRLEMVPDPRPASGAPSHRCRRLRPS